MSICTQVQTLRPPPKLSGSARAHHPAAPGSFPKQKIYASIFPLKFELKYEKDENNTKKRLGLAHIFSHLERPRIF